MTLRQLTVLMTAAVVFRGASLAQNNVRDASVRVDTMHVETTSAHGCTPPLSR